MYLNVVVAIVVVRSSTDIRSSSIQKLVLVVLAGSSIYG